MGYGVRPALARAHRFCYKKGAEARSGRVAINGQYSVSVVIPAYNVDKHIGQALDSVLLQRRPAKEIIVVDDCSTDDTLDVLQRYALAFPESITVLNTEASSGMSAARSRGIQAAKGDVVALLDGDGYWKDCHLEIVVELLERHPKASWAFSETATLFPDGRLERYGCGGSKVDHDAFDGFDRFAGVCGAQKSTMVIRRAVFDRVEHLATEYRRTEDYDLFMDISKDHPVIHSPEVTTFWRKQELASQPIAERGRPGRVDFAVSPTS